MKSSLLLTTAFCLLALACSERAAAQTYDRVSDKRVTPVKGRTLVLKGTVRDGDEVVYRFRARAGQRLSVKLVGRDADFSLFLNWGLDVERVAQDVKTWSGRMPAEFRGDCEIAVHSNYKLAGYRIEILLR